MEIKHGQRDVLIYEHPIYEKDKNTGKRVRKGHIAILVGGFDKDNPKGYMDKVVKKYAGENSYNEFIESFLDNPWVRVVTIGINEIDFKEYEGKVLKKIINK